MKILNEGIIYTEIKHIYTLNRELVIETQKDGKFFVLPNSALFDSMMRKDMHYFIGFASWVGIRYKWQEGVWRDRRCTLAVIYHDENIPEELTVRGKL